LWLKDEIHQGFSSIVASTSTTSRRSFVGNHNAVNANAITEISAVTLTYLSFFNNIVALCIAIALISPECFFYIYNAASSVTTTNTVPGCEISALGFSLRYSVDVSHFLCDSRFSSSQFDHILADEECGYFGGIEEQGFRRKPCERNETFDRKCCSRSQNGKCTNCFCAIFTI
jgi:hypothetical protein